TAEAGCSSGVGAAPGRLPGELASRCVRRLVRDVGDGAQPLSDWTTRRRTYFVCRPRPEVVTRDDRDARLRRLADLLFHQRGGLERITGVDVVRFWSAPPTHLRRERAA